MKTLKALSLLTITALTSFSIFAVDMSSPPDSLVVTPTGEVGVGTAVPMASLSVERSDGSAKVLVEENTATTAKRTLMELINNGAPSMQYTNTNSGSIWQLNPDAADNFIISQLGTGGPEVQIRKTTGNMVVRGTVSSQGMLLTSSRETKEEFMPVDNAEILDKVAQLKISEWKFKTDSADAPRHIGPMAEDFEQAFELGTDGKTIGVTDMNGITLASIQALNHKLTAKDTELAELRFQNAAQNERLDKLERLLLVK